MPISLSAAVLLTLAYTDQFAYPLSGQELKQRLISTQVSTPRLKQVLASLQQRGLITRQEDKYKLSNGRADEELRAKRRALSQAKWAEVDTLKKIMSWVPGIKAVAVTGSLSMDNLRSQTDIDLMVVTLTGRLWLARLLVMLVAWVVGQRRTWRGKGGEGWCFNLWLDEAGLGLPRNKRNIYSAYEICQAKWVLDRAGVQRQFLDQNSWVRAWLPSFYEVGLSSAAKSEMKSNSGRTSFWGWLISSWLDLLDWVLFRLQYLYMYPHLTRERVNRHQAFFHPRPTWQIIYRRWYGALWALLSDGTSDGSAVTDRRQ